MKDPGTCLNGENKKINRFLFVFINQLSPLVSRAARFARAYLAGYTVYTNFPLPIISTFPPTYTEISCFFFSALK